MIIPEEKFFDRIEQSFWIMKGNFFLLITPMLIFNIAFLVIIPAAFMLVFFSLYSLENIFHAVNSWEAVFQLYPVIGIWIFIGIIFMVLYFCILIPVQVALITSIKQTYKWWNITLGKNLRFWISKLLDAFRTYWYVFCYTLLIPAVIFIIWWIVLNFWLYTDIKTYTLIWWSIMILSLLLCIYYSLYRWIKSSFALISAVDSWNYTKDNFKIAVNITEWKWWRIFWNLIWIWFFWWLVIGLIGWIWGSLEAIWNNQQSLWFLIESSLYNGEVSFDEISSSISPLNILGILNSLFQNILGTILGVFIYIFLYIYFKRLQDELHKWEKNPEEL